MKVYISPHFDLSKPDEGQGGIKRVVENQIKFLPAYGVELVDSPNKADVLNCHAIEYV